MCQPTVWSDRSVRSAHLWVFEANPRAQAFYRKHAFHPHGRRATDPDTGLEELLYVRDDRWRG